jgi:hypothetical protein
MRYGPCLIDTIMDSGVVLIRGAEFDVGGELRSGQIWVLIRSVVPYSHSGHYLYTLKRLGRYLDILQHVKNRIAHQSEKSSMKNESGWQDATSIQLSTTILSPCSLNTTHNN